MVYELERVLRVCNGFLCSMSVTYDGAVLITTDGLNCYCGNISAMFIIILVEVYKPRSKFTFDDSKNPHENRYFELPRTEQRQKYIIHYITPTSTDSMLHYCRRSI